MFLNFKNAEQRRKYGGSAFIEFQYCTLPAGTKLKKTVSVKTIDFWKDDSLYVFVDDIDDFISDYREIFNNGIYGNLKSGECDIYGINYYPPERLKEIIGKTEKIKTADGETLLQWLKHGENRNGFYILGI